jgi:hypothetical protein
VPYHQHGLDFIIETMKHLHQSGDSFNQTKQVISNQNIEKELPLENGQIVNFKQLFKETFSKLCATPPLKKQLEDTVCFNNNDPVGSVLEFIEKYKTSLSLPYQSNISNPAKLSLDFFYNYQSTPYFERLFLFGVPSQKR